jgi:3-oxoadipate enol-lactonase
MGRYAAASGSSIYFEDAGTGPPVLALHGVGGGAYFFHGLSDRLQNRYRIVAVDYPGVGFSTAGRGAFSLDGWVADLGGFVADTFDRPVVVLGHSLGTIVGLEVWRSWPSRIAGMVFVGGLPEVRPPVRERLTDRSRAIRQDGIEGWGVKVAAGVFSAASVRQHPEAVGMFARLFETQPPDVYVESLRILMGANAWPVVPTVTVPCFSISGSDDTYAPPDAVSEFLDRFPTRPDQIVLPEVGHMPFFEAPADFASAVEHCLNAAMTRIASPAAAP